MMKKLTIFAMLALLLAACGTTQQNNNGGNSAGNQATAVEALEVTQQPVQSGGAEVEYTVETDLEEELGIPFSFMPMNNGFFDVFTSPVSDWDCSESTVSGDVSDADDDGIAKNATYTIKCTKSFASLPMIGDTVVVERTGTLTMKDADDNDPTSGYTSTGDITYNYMNGAFTAEHEFSRSWTKQNGTYAYDHTNAWTWSAGGVNYGVEHAHRGSYTPDDTADPFTAGQLSETASVKHYVDGALEHTVSETANLHLNKACTPPADSGTIAFTFNGMTRVVEFTGCGEYEIQTP